MTAGRAITATLLGCLIAGPATASEPAITEGGPANPERDAILSRGEFQDTAWTIGAGRLAIHPLAEPWHWGALPWLDLQFSVQSALLPGPELRVEAAPLQGRLGALSFEAMGSRSWSAGFEAALRVAAEREDDLPGASNRFLETMTGDLSASSYTKGVGWVRGSISPTATLGVHLNLGAGAGRVAGATVVELPAVLLVDGRVGDRTMLRGGVTADLITLGGDSKSWSIEARWSHAWDRFRVEAGARVVTGWPAEASYATIEQITGTTLIDIPFFPSPTLRAWWRF